MAYQSGFDVLRPLVPDHRELLLADEVELRRRIPADIPEIVRLDQWRHPDLLQDTLPSQSMTFRQLANVLTIGDVGRYAPDMPPNTHRSNWPKSGNLQPGRSRTDSGRRAYATRCRLRRSVMAGFGTRGAWQPTGVRSSRVAFHCVSGDLAGRVRHARTR
ncbi:DUF7003 family protein [Micromonospora tarensis]|uniref:DUF7003 family protein n=1 Tax=Micromonospora tarensis TaxID=2806100 RepID=UPI003899434D